MAAEDVPTASLGAGRTGTRELPAASYRPAFPVSTHTNPRDRPEVINPFRLLVTLMVYKLRLLVSSLNTWILSTT